MTIRDYDLLIPMDVDKKKIHAVIMDQERILGKMTFPYDAQNIFQYVQKKFAGQKVLFAYEAGPTGYGLYDFFMEKKANCVVAVPSMIPRAPGERVKTNRLDAVRLGHQLKGGELKFVQVPEKLYRDLKHLVRLRCRYGKGIIATKNRLKGIFLFEGLAFPEGKWSSRVINELKQVCYRQAVAFKVGELLRDFEYYRKEELTVKAEIRRFCRSNQELKDDVGYLMSLPGVGWIVSTYILAAIGGRKHLKNTASTCHFFGLGPREHSTGELIRRGSITAAGDPTGRKMIIQAAWVAVRKDQALRDYFWKIFARNPKQIAKQKAIVAVARKLLCRMHAVLRDQRLYQ